MTITPRTFRMTIASTWYDNITQKAREYEMHYKAARRGSIVHVRRHLAKRGIKHFQQTVYRLFKRWIPKNKIRIAFEREELAKKVECLIQIEVRALIGRGRRWTAFGLPSRVLTYSKKKRKRKQK